MKGFKAAVAKYNSIGLILRILAGLIIGGEVVKDLVGFVPMKGERLKRIFRELQRSLRTFLGSFFVMDGFTGSVPARSGRMRDAMSEGWAGAIIDDLFSRGV